MAILGLCFGSACGPRAHIPPRPVTIPGALDDTDRVAKLARGLAPVLYLQRDEWFPLSRAVAVVHPDRRVIAYHLLWKDDVHGSWIPFTVATDEEVVWVAYDSTNAPTDLWTFWHGSILHADWRQRGTPAVDVQWGKHGSLPRGIIESDLPRGQTLNAFYALAYIGLPDILLGKLTRLQDRPASFTPTSATAISRARCASVILWMSWSARRTRASRSQPYSGSRTRTNGHGPISPTSPCSVPEALRSSLSHRR